MNKLFIVSTTLALSMLLNGCNGTSSDGGADGSSLDITSSTSTGDTSGGTSDGLGGLPLGTSMGGTTDGSNYDTDASTSSSAEAGEEAGDSEQSAGETQEEAEEKDSDDAKSYADDDDDDTTDDTSSQNSISVNFLPLGEINATADGVPYTLIALKDLDNGLQATGYGAGSITGQLLIQIVGYDLQRDGTINIDTGSLMLQFEVDKDSFAAGSGSYNLIYPKTNGGLINITSVLPENDKYKITGNLEVDVPREDNPNATFHLSSQFGVTLLNLEN